MRQDRKRLVKELGKKRQARRTVVRLRKLGVDVRSLGRTAYAS